jgi:mono/diheme cytochrome c family protein/rhodanese-related sulfurtransferase
MRRLTHPLHQVIALLGLSICTITAVAAEYLDIRELTPGQSRAAASNYEKYCVLCHGADRQGYVNDHAPSLRSKSLFESGVPHAILRPLSYGRKGTPMGGYLDEVGGPMTLAETWDLTYWLYEQSGAEAIPLSTNPVHGDIERGASLYQAHCTECHGVNGEGVDAPALFNASALAHNTDEFLRYAIQNGRQGTRMEGFAGKLSDEDINNLTAFLRSRASGTGDGMEKPVLQALPTPDEYVINPDGEDPDFTLAEGKYVSSSDLYQALQDKKKMALFDTRVTSVWQTAHIEGSFPLPYYEDFEIIAAALPRDVMVVAYCSCPRASAEWVAKNLKKRGVRQTAVLYEGIFGWINQGYPVVRRDIRE